MLKQVLRPFKPLLRWMVDGRQFRRYTRPNLAAQPGPVLRVAICQLIPNLGDTVMVFPLLDALRREHPEAEITCFTSGIGRVLSMHPAVAKVFEFRRRSRWANSPRVFAYLYDLWSWWRRDLRDLRFDVCVVLRGGADPFHNAHLAWLLGARKRVGYAWKLEPERCAGYLHGDVLFTRLVDSMRGVHEVERGAEVLQLAGLLSGPVDITATVPSVAAIAHKEEGKTFVASFPELAGNYGIISPGASTPRREWPLDRFAEIAEEYCRRGWVPVFIGGAELASACDEIAARLSCHSLNLAGKTGFEELVAVCASAQCFVGNDSGTGHVAGACGVPVVIISAFAASGRKTHHASLERSRPLGPRYFGVMPAAQIAPCTEECVALEPHCITQVSVAEVLAAMEALLSRAGHTQKESSA